MSNEIAAGVVFCQKAEQNRGYPQICYFAEQPKLGTNIVIHKQHYVVDRVNERGTVFAVWQGFTHGKAVVDETIYPQRMMTREIVQKDLVIGTRVVLVNLPEYYGPSGFPRVFVRESVLIVEDPDDDGHVHMKYAATGQIRTFPIGEVLNGHVKEDSSKVKTSFCTFPEVDPNITPKG